MLEELSYIKLVDNIMHYADSHNWQGLEFIFADQVLLDYSSFTGQAAETLSGKEIAARWADYLPGYEVTQHKLFNHQLTRAAEKTQLHATGRAIHIITGAEGGDTWLVDGSYDFEINPDHKVTLMRFNLAETSGNNKLPELALSRAAPKTT